MDGTTGGLGPNDFAPQLQELEAKGVAYFLAGGQAVNVWAEVYSEECPKLAGLAPFTSRDCDIWLAPGAIERLAQVLEGKLFRASSPSDGQLGIFHVEGDKARLIDLLDGVFGLSTKEVQRAYLRSMVLNGVRILDPLFLFKGKCHNLASLPQAGRQDEKHLRILLEILPAHFSVLLESSAAGTITPRQFIKEVKTFLDFDKDKWVRKAMGKLGANLMEAVPWGRMRNSTSQVIGNLAKSEGPPYEE